MYENRLWRIMEAYEHMDEYPRNTTEEVRVYDIVWDDEDLETNPEFEDVVSEDMTIEYTQEYEGDHRDRESAVRREFSDFYGCEPLTFEIELRNVLESTEQSAPCRLYAADIGMYLADEGGGRVICTSSPSDAKVFENAADAKRCAARVPTFNFEPEPVA
jgi:hypothetical protein